MKLEKKSRRSKSLNRLAIVGFSSFAVFLLLVLALLIAFTVEAARSFRVVPSVKIGITEPSKPEEQHVEIIRTQQLDAVAETEEVPPEPIETGRRTLNCSDTLFGSAAIPRYKVSNITFLNSTGPTSETWWDASVEKDRSIIAWLVPSEKLSDKAELEMYDLFIGSKFDIDADEGLSFSEFENLESLAFQIPIHTSSVKDFSAMFQNTGIGSQIPFTLDLSGWDVSNAVTMENMFFGCATLQQVRLRKKIYTPNTGLTSIQHWGYFLAI